MLVRPHKSDSPLARLDARVRLLLCLTASLGILLPPPCLILLGAGMAVLLIWGKLIQVIARYVYKFVWLLLILVLVNTIMVNGTFALVFVLRLLLLAFSFIIFTETTSIEEIYLILRWLKCPYHLAFSFSVALQFMPVLSQEWHMVKEAQWIRGIHLQPAAGRTPRKIFTFLQGLLPFIIPVIVLTVKRAWNLTEAAYLRGIDAPFEAAVPSLCLQKRDYAFLLNWGVFYLVILGVFYR